MGRDVPKALEITGHIARYCLWAGPHNIAVYPWCPGCGRDFGRHEGGARVSVQRDAVGVLFMVYACTCGTTSVLQDLFVGWAWGNSVFPQGAATERDTTIVGRLGGRYYAQQTGRDHWVERYEQCEHCGAELGERGPGERLGGHADDPAVVVRQVACRCGETVLRALCGIRDSAGRWVSGAGLPRTGSASLRSTRLG